MHTYVVFCLSFYSCFVHFLFLSVDTVTIHEVARRFAEVILASQVFQHVSQALPLLAVNSDITEVPQSPKEFTILDLDESTVVSKGLINLDQFMKVSR